MSYASLDEAFPSIDEGPPTKKTKKSNTQSVDFFTVGQSSEGKANKVF